MVRLTDGDKEKYPDYKLPFYLVDIASPAKIDGGVAGYNCRYFTCDCTKFDAMQTWGEAYRGLRDRKFIVEKGNGASRSQVVTGVLAETELLFRNGADTEIKLTKGARRGRGGRAITAYSHRRLKEIFKQMAEVEDEE